MESITGTVRDVKGPFKGGWCILSVNPIGTDEPGPISVVGTLSEFQQGDVATFQGIFKNHPSFGRQFKAQFAAIEVPRDVNALRDYLDRNFTWIGPVLAEKLVSEFGDRLFDVMKNSHSELAKIKGITPERASEIHDEYCRIEADRETDLWFSRHHISLNMRNKLMAEYGSKKEVIATVLRNPYILADDVYGVGFKKADVIALSVGIKRDSSIRAGACLRYILKEAGHEGHCFLPREELIVRCLEMIASNDQQIVEAAIADGVNGGKVIQIGEQYAEQVYTNSLYEAEIATASMLRELAQSPHSEIVSNLSEDEIKELDADQQTALLLALSSKIIVVTGGPGVGKTFTINRIIRALGDRDIELAAPTGKAAKRMGEMTGQEARTIHRLLEYNPQFGGFARNRDNPLECDTLIIDETSMIDAQLMHSLMDAITLKTQVIFVGDVDQLPSVGPGRVLSDMIESGVIPVARLSTLHRQAGESLININAKIINAGGKLELNSRRNDFWFVPEEIAENIPEQIIKVIKAVPKNFCLEDGLLSMPQTNLLQDVAEAEGKIRRFTLDDIQVLCPQKRGACGTEKLNEALRPVLNPDGRKLHGTQFLTGDRVIQMRNNYDLWIFNGDIGTVLDADPEFLHIQFDDLKGKKTVYYPKENVMELQLAYALTVHKSQGSEFPVVIIPVHTTNFVMLKKNLLYTGVTRGKKLVVLVGTMKAANIAIRTTDSNQRYSNLRDWIKNGN
jgi:exodeoxyribonuclease V alpha subunit